MDHTLFNASILVCDLRCFYEHLQDNPDARSEAGRATTSRTQMRTASRVSVLSSVGRAKRTSLSSLPASLLALMQVREHMSPV